MDKIEKFLKNLTKKELISVLAIINKIEKGDFTGLDIKKLSGHNNIYRARKGSVRIIFTKVDDCEITIVSIERRSDTTYNF